jgi:hypothetical protein
MTLPHAERYLAYVEQLAPSIPTDALKRLVAQRVAADAAAAYNRAQEGTSMSKSARQQRAAAARDGRHDSKWWKGQAAKEKAAGNDAAAKAHRQHAANRLRDARRVDPDR